MTDGFIAEKKRRGELASGKQRRASDPKKSVWVEASAGTGKTKVLSDRVLRLLLDGVNPAKILCLTYTKAAAVEMSSRIAGRLGRWAVLNDEDLHGELESLLGELPAGRREYEKLHATARRLFAQFLDTAGGMKIQTIHSFCQEVLKRFPIEAGISPYFEVMSERSSVEALNDIKAKILQNSKDSEALLYLTRNVSEFTFPKIMKMIADNRNEIAWIFSDSSSDKLVGKLSGKLGVGPNDTKEGFIAEFCKVREIEDFEEYRARYLKKDGELRAKLKEDELDEAYVLTELDNKLVSVDLLQSTKAVLTLAGDLIEKYNEYKKIHSKMDYEDLIVLTRNLLENKAVAAWVLYKLDGGIDHILIDEAQDTSPNQWAIVKAVSEEILAGSGVRGLARTIFAVGDRKQSIYSFQGADVREFEKTKTHFSTQIEGFEKIDLDVSFRSVSAVLDVVNKVFDKEPAHVPFRAGDAGKVELWPLIEEEEGENLKVWRKPVERLSSSSTSARLAKQIVSKIKQMVEGGEVLASKGRPVRYKDFLILVQRRNSFVEELVRECKNQNVAVAGIDKIKLEEQIAVQDLIVLGKFLLLPTDDLSLATVLKSPVFGLDDDDLFELCHNRGKANLWSALSNNPKYAEVYKRLQSLLNMVDFNRPFELYSYVLNELSGRKKFVERMGLDVEDGLDEFVNLTIDFESEHIPSMQKFVQWVESGDVEIKRETEQSDLDVVRIMTVHGSKGLQAPIVILPDTVRTPMIRKEGGILFGEELIYFPLSSAHFEKSCLGIFEENSRAQSAEYNRLLYVALTRAEDRLVVCGYMKKNKPKPESWYSVCEAKFAEMGREENGIKVYETAQHVEVKPAKVVKEVVLTRPDFPWINRPAVKEGPLARPLSPSKLYEDEEEPALSSPLEVKKNSYRRGSVIHKLLQFVSEVEASKREQVIDEFLKGERGFEGIKAEVLELLKVYPELFDENSKAEVSIMGEVDGKIFSGQIDRLKVTGSEVLIVDYKTNREVAKDMSKLPAAYKRQMEAYKKLVEKIYAGKTVRCFILWTNSLEMMQIMV